MALATEIVGDGILIGVDNSPRVWRVYGFEGVYIFEESQRVEVREWVALTQSAAKTAAENASQEGLPEGAVAAYAANEDTRVMASYKLTKTIDYGPTVTRTYEEYPA